MEKNTIKVEALFVSDVHLGSKGSNPKELLAISLTFTETGKFDLTTKPSEISKLLFKSNS
jgi:hypothetical protein